MVDKTPIVANNCWMADCSELLKTANTAVEEAYQKGFIRGVERAGVRSKQCKHMKHDSFDELCPHCGMILRQYEGLKICYCKFCGGKIER